MTVNIDRADVLWDFRELRDWEARYSALRKLNIDMNVRDLDKFAFFFAKTINRICTCLVEHERIPQDLFSIRDIYVEKVTDFHIEYINTHVQALLALARQDFDYQERERSQVLAMREFFAKERDKYDAEVAA